MRADIDLPTPQRSRQLTHNLRHAMPEILFGLFSSLLFAVTLWQQSEQTSLAIWLAVAMGLYILRFVLAVRTKSTGLYRQSRWFSFCLLMILTGVLWAVAAHGVFLQEDGFIRAAFLLWLVCMLFGVAIVYLGSLSMLFGFGVPVLASTLYGLSQQAEPWNPYFITALITLSCFVVLMSLVARRYRVDQQGAAEIYDSLNQKFALLQDDAQELSLALNTARRQSDDAKSALQSATANLSQCQSTKSSLAKTLQSTLKNDPVTKLANRRGFFEVLDKEWQRSIRSHDPLTLAFISIDDFDTVSEKTPRDTIVSSLKTIGQSVKSHGRRAGDVHGRIDKSDFALLLQGADAENAARIIENIRDDVAKLNLKPSENGKPLTVHAGVATLVPNRRSSSETLIERVESATYEAAFQGGDRVVSFQSFSNLESHPWNASEDGILNEENLQQKMLALGFTIKREIIPPRTRFRDQSFNRPTLFAVLSGVFKLNVEGQLFELKRGAYLIMPEGVSFNAEVVGSEAVHLYLEDR